MGKYIKAENYSPMRYPGGKGKLSGYFKELFKQNRLYDCIYFEPYAGGAGVALSLLFNQYAQKIVINDFDLSIYALWFSIVNKTEKLCELISKTKIDINTWKEMKEINKTEKENILKLGFSTLFLNRTNRSGIINAGVIGGLDQKGTWKIDARFNKEKIIERIHRIAKYKHSIEVHNMDAIELIKTHKLIQGENSFIYLDPPYYKKGKDLYLNYYNDDDHKNVLNCLENVSPKKWVVTYDNIEYIKQLYKRYRVRDYSLSYCAYNYKNGSEIAIYSDSLIIPEKITAPI